jgi:hypothetical protein
MSMLAFVLTAGAVVAQAIVTFDEGTALPKGWTSGITGHGAANWAVSADATAHTPPHVLRQSGEATFCWAVKNDAQVKDGFAEVKLKPSSGSEDQAGGLVWRFKDANNYYVVRANALEDNVVLYKIISGKRSSLQLKGRMFGYGVDTEVPKDNWSTLRVEFQDNLFTVLLNGHRLFQVEDDALIDAGAVGVWTKADSVTLFDDFAYGAK